MNQSNKAPKPLTHRIGDNPKNREVLKEVNDMLRQANEAFAEARPTLYRWIDRDTHNVVIGTKREWEIHLASL